MIVFKKRKLKNTIASLCLLSISLLPIASWAEEVYWLTQVGSPFNLGENTDGLLLSYPTDLDGGFTVITVKNNKINLSRNLYSGIDCTVEIKQILPFSVDRFSGTIGLGKRLESITGSGYDKDERFLKTQLHTDMKQWNAKYKIKPAKTRECLILDGANIYGSNNEIIVYNYSYFYRFITRKEKWVKNFKEVSGYLEVDCTKVTVDYLEKNTSRCRYSDEVDKASGKDYSFMCDLKNEDELMMSMIYPTQKICQDNSDTDLGNP